MNSFISPMSQYMNNMNQKLRVLIPESSQFKTLKNTKSFCPFCGRVIDSEIVEAFGKVFLKKKCCNEEMIYHLENDVGFFVKDQEIRLKFGINRYTRKIKSYLEMLKSLEKDTNVLYIYTTLRCNLNCPICYLKFDNLLRGPKEEKYDLPFIFVKRAIEKTSAEVIVFTGGEPTLYPKLIEAIKYAKRRGKKAIILTNGLRLTNKRYLKKLVDAGLYKVWLSFDGFNDYVYQLLRGKSLLKEKLNALKNLKEFGLKVHLVSVIGKNINEREVPKIINFAVKNNDFIKEIGFTSLRTKKYTEFTTAPSDVIKIASTCIDNFKVDDVHLWTQFSYGIYQLIRKLFDRTILEDKIRKKISFLLSGHDLLLKVDKNGVRPLLSSEELKTINEVLEKALTNNDKIVTIAVILRNIRRFLKPIFFKLIIGLFKRRFRPSEVLDNLQVLRIHFARVDSIHTRIISDFRKLKTYPPIITYGVL